jgi:amino acid adenylation domain-containing protein
MSDVSGTSTLTIKSLLASLKARQIYLYLQNGKLKLRTQLDEIPSELMAQIKQYKPEIIEYIKVNQVKKGPLSSVQARMWFVDRYEARDFANNITGLIEIRGPLDVARLERAFAQLIQRHDILRTRYKVQENGNVVQWVDERSEFAFGHRTWHDDDKEKEKVKVVDQAAVEQLLSDDLNYRFDLEQELLVRAALLEAPVVEVRGCLSEQPVHWLSIAIHHINIDGGSVQILLDELFTLYRAAKDSLAPGLPALELQYLDYAIWQKQQRQSADMANKMDYWQQQLKDLDPFVLLGDFPRPHIKSNQGKTLHFTIAPEIALAFLKLCGRELSSPFMGGLALLNLLFYRYNNQEDIAIGVPVSTRSKTEFEPLIGCFLNTIVMRNQLTPTMSFGELLQQTKYLVLDGLENQDAEFDQVVAALDLPKSSAHTPIFQMLYNFENLENLAVEVEDLTATAKLTNKHSAEFDLVFHLRNGGDGLQGSIDYASALYEHQSMANLVAGFEHLMAEVTADPEQLLHTIRLTDASRYSVVQQLAQQPFESVLSQFESCCTAHPDSLAVTDGHQQLTYQQLNHQANQLASLLLADAPQKDAPESHAIVAMMLPRSVDAIVSVLAVLKAGMACLPLDVSLSDQQILAQLDQVSVKTLLSHPEFAHRQALFRAAGEAGVRVKYFESLQHSAALSPLPLPSLLPLHTAKPDDLVCVVFDGSSAVRFEQCYLADTVSGLNQQIGYHGQSVSALLTDMATGVTSGELFALLTTGGTVLIPAAQQLVNVDVLAALMVEQQVNVFHLTPSIGKVLLPALAKVLDHQTALQWVNSGEALIPELARLIVQHWPESQLFNHYYSRVGGHCLYAVSPSDLTPLLTTSLTANADTLPIGQPLAGTGCYVLDQYQNPMPVGMPGELYIGTSGVKPVGASGRFIANPFGDNGATPWLYRTGDWGRLTGQGQFEYISRVDEQVKVTGFALRLNDIEAQINTLDGIVDSAVIPYQVAGQAAYLAAFVITGVGFAANNCDHLSAQLQQQLQQKLPQHMLPTTFTAIDSMPLKANGKRDQDALLEYQLDREGQSIEVWRPDYTGHRQGVSEGTQCFEFNLDAPVQKSLTGLADDKLAVKVQSLLFSGFVVALSKLVGQSDILIGVTGEQQTPQWLGQCVYPQALSVDIDANDDLATLIYRLGQHYLQLSERRPIEQRLAELADTTARDSHYQLIFNWQMNSNKGDWIKRVLLPDCQIQLSMTQNDKGISGCIDYATQHFSATTIERLAEVYQRVLNAFVACAEKAGQPEQAVSIGQIDILSAQERHTLLHTWNQTDAPYPQDKTLPQLFEQQVEKTPDAIALVFAGEQLTYRQLNQRANQLAQVIQEQYFQRIGEPMVADTLIALYFDRSLDMLISLLAVLKAGGAYVPISPEHPGQRVVFILEDTQAAIVITQQKYHQRLKQWFGDLDPNLCQEEMPLPSLLIADDASITKDAATVNPEPVSQPTSLAYIIYTSGSTGQPKGVMIEQHSVANHLIGLEARMGKVFKRVDFSTNYCFDLSVTTYLFPLLVGGCVFIFDDEVTNLIRYTKHLRGNEIDFVKTTPSIAALIDGQGYKIDTLMVGGERLTPNVIVDLSKSVNRLFNEYGPTEATIGSTATWVESPQQTHIGKAFANVKLYVLSEQLQPVPIGVVGELYIGGAGIARGYHQRADLTAEKFIDNPFAHVEESNSRLYKTGDLVRWLADGNVEFIGRNDFQVKIRGFRIELGEIERVLAALPAVKQAVVIDNEQAGQQSLAAYVVFESTQSLTMADLSGGLANKLPDYMVPTTFTVLDSIPLTVNGKLDRRALPEPVRVQQSSAYVAPTNATEKMLCEIWQQVLGLEQVSINEDFFKLGGHSLTGPEWLLR